jgi:biotin operon repressor
MNRKSGSRRNDPKDSAVEVMLTLLRAARAIEDRFDAALAKANLSGPKFGALTALAKAGEPLSLGDLAAKLTCVRSNITQLVDRLEADGLVRRVAGARVIANLEKEMGTAMSALDHDALKRVLEAFK